MRYTIILFLLLISCEKFVEVEEPRTQLTSTTVFTNDATATAAMLGVYSDIMQNFGFLSGCITLYAGLSADEFRNYSSAVEQEEFASNTLFASNSQITHLWGGAYRSVYASNAIIENLKDSEGVTEPIRKQLTGEALFLRAFTHFYLVNLFGDIPLITGTDYQVNATKSRTPKDQVYEQIIDDLKEAQLLLPENYLDGKNSVTSERVRPNKLAATALLARVYLYTRDWVNAELQASVVLNNAGMYSLLTDLNTVFLMNSSETIWQLMPVRNDINTWEGNNFLFSAEPTGIYASAITDSLVAAFEPADNRKNSWITSVNTGSGTYQYPYKYKVGISSTLTEYYTALRLAEQFLIRAEARAKQGNISGAQEDLNAIRSRAGLDNTNANSEEPLLSAIEAEKRVEFFCEWGHRWLELKRTNRADAVLAPYKGSNWQSTDLRYPIPAVEIQNNPNLFQNPGY